MSFYLIFLNLFIKYLLFTEIVEQEALIRALKEHKIFSAGLDVMTPEPLPPTSELMTIDNCGTFFIFI